MRNVGILTYIWPKCMVNVGKWAIHGASEKAGILSNKSKVYSKHSLKARLKMGRDELGTPFQWIAGPHDVIYLVVATLLEKYY